MSHCLTFLSQQAQDLGGIVEVVTRVVHYILPSLHHILQDAHLVVVVRAESAMFCLQVSAGPH